MTQPNSRNNPSKPLTILALSHSAVVEVYQDKYALLAEYPDISLSLALPQEYREGSGIVPCYNKHTNFTVFTHPAPFGNQAKQNAFFLRNLKKTFLTVQPDIVYFEEEPESLVSCQILYLISTLPKRPTAVMYSCSNIPLQKRLPYESRAKQLLLPLFERYTLPRIDGLVCMNSEGMSMFRTEYNVHVPMTVLAQYGFSPERFFPADSKTNAKKVFNCENYITIGYAGRLLTMKGLLILFDALKIVVESQPNVRLLLLGNGNDKPQLQARADELGISDNIIFLPAVPAEQVPQFYRALDIFILPSLTTPLWKEQFGRVIVEAMASGVPVIGSSSGAIPEVIGDGGLVYNEHSPDELASSIVLLLRNETLRLELADKALRRATTEYSNQVIANRLYKFVTELHYSG